MRSSTSIEIRFRCWVDIGGEKFFGPGPAELLEGIESTGSIAQSAKLMGLSYKKAWSMVTVLNSKGKAPYILLQKGGQHGGGASLTKEGKKALTSFRRLEAKFNKLIQQESKRVLVDF